MKTDYFKKDLAIGVIVLFVCVGISSAVAIKEIKLNNNDVINSSNVVSTEDLPDLKIVYSSTDVDYDEFNHEYYQMTWVEVKNIGDVSINGYVRFKFSLYHGIGPLSRYLTTFGPETEKLDLAPGESQSLVIIHNPGDDIHHFYKFVYYVNYDKIIEESNYRNNVALQNFYVFRFIAYPIWFWIGPLRYPLFGLHQLGI